MNHNHFISYSRVDSEFALRLVRDLRSLGIEVWFDQIDIPPGANWDDEIERALERAKVVIVVLSDASGQSQNVRNEIGHALDQGKQVVPVLLSKGMVPLRITRLQREDFSGEYQIALAKLTRRLSGESKTGSLQAITPADVQREAREAALRLSAGTLPGSAGATRDEPRVRLSEPDALITSSTARPPSRAEWQSQRVLLLGLGLAAVAGAGVVLLRTVAGSPPSPEAREAEKRAAVATGSTKVADPVQPQPTEQSTRVAAAPQPPTPGRGALLCSEPGFAGVCESITKDADLGSSQVGNDTVSSIRLGTCRAVKVCSNVEFGGLCDSFDADQPDLSRTRVGDDSVSSIECLDGSAPPARGALLCREPGFGGLCETLGTSAQMFASQVGNDAVSSIRLGTCRAVKLCSNIDFGGECETFSGDQADLSGTRVGDKSASSIECLGGAPANANARAAP